ncbi:hydrogenase maturation protease [Acidobacteria bacterium AB60]|nr:hydrogenase maturation protease [Acidobacteria bacterium AB60]
MPSHPGKTLILGLGNIILGDEGVGVHVVRSLLQHPLPPGVECLDGGTGGFVLLEPLQQADRILLIDATDDGMPAGTVTRTKPQFSRDYPPTMTAHDIGVKDLLDAFYLQGGKRDVTLFTVSIDPHQSISMELTEECSGAVAVAVQQILEELACSAAAA